MFPRWTIDPVEMIKKLSQSDQVGKFLIINMYIYVYMYTYVYICIYVLYVSHH